MNKKIKIAVLNSKWLQPGQEWSRMTHIMEPLSDLIDRIEAQALVWMKTKREVASQVCWMVAAIAE
jgi:hypothetical protein